MVAPSDSRNTKGRLTSAQHHPQGRHLPELEQRPDRELSVESID